jgi:hypothetical protein
MNAETNKSPKQQPPLNAPNATGTAKHWQSFPKCPNGRRSGRYASKLRTEASNRPFAPRDLSLSATYTANCKHHEPRENSVDQEILGELRSTFKKLKLGIEWLNFLRPDRRAWR